MNKSHHVSKAASRARSAIPAASVRQSVLESDDFDEAGEAPWLNTLQADEEDWPELEDDAQDVETEIGLLLKGVSYR